ncbi:hypothetical protein A2Z56_04370 [Candidatus Kaiserbacteria bacterium RIFCSPHIGHO2_12_45_16]|nr:MAG: hypothetical protein A2Z56_04370 [Candidatus Kaiserbacteria bacterium RIFCSPHIGHO2_12_45_16]
MSSRGLSKEEIKKRLIRLRNLDYLHEVQRFKIWHLRDENRELRKEIKALKLLASEQQKTIDDLKLQIEELRTIVFGRKKQKGESDDDDLLPPKEKNQRTSDSYKRPAPSDAEVMEIKNHPIDTCNFCHGALSKKETVVFFEEDIPIPIKKIVQKHLVEKGYCLKCRKWVTGIPLPPHKVTLGPNVQKYVCYLSVMCRLSYSQIKQVLRDSYSFALSEGEIAKILCRQATRFRPEYERLKEKIREESVIHLDETGWKILQGGLKSFAWVISGGQSGESAFLLGESRGAGNVEKLRGEDYKGVTVTDDYMAYKKLPLHQLCWSHLIRKFRDFAKSDEVPENQRTYYGNQYQTVAEIFSDIEKNRHPSLRSIYTEKLEKLAVITRNDCKKMIRVKKTLFQNISKYLTCLSSPEIPLTNNLAERSLRHLVLKRKISFGSLTKRTADNLAILLSVLLSRRQRDPLNWFGVWLGV